MTSAKNRLVLLLGMIAFSIVVPLARADSFGFYETGTFQVNSTAISGNAGGICQGQCLPWGEIVIVNVSFAASVMDYQQSVSCANSQCQTQITGSFDQGSVTAELSVFGNSSETYWLTSNSLQGSFSSHFCTGHCGTYRPETELSLDFQGLWSNDWYSDGMIQMECFRNGGCSDGTGPGSLDTDAPEPSSIVLLLGGIPCLGFAILRKLS